jgi:hypothetical protein
MTVMIPPMESYVEFFAGRLSPKAGANEPVWPCALRNMSEKINTGIIKVEKNGHFQPLRANAGDPNR